MTGERRFEARGMVVWRDLRSAREQRLDDWARAQDGSLRIEWPRMARSARSQTPGSPHLRPVHQLNLNAIWPPEDVSCRSRRIARPRGSARGWRPRVQDRARFAPDPATLLPAEALRLLEIDTKRIRHVGFPIPLAGPQARSRIPCTASALRSGPPGRVLLHGLASCQSSCSSRCGPTHSLPFSRPGTYANASRMTAASPFSASHPRQDDFVHVSPCPIRNRRVVNANRHVQRLLEKQRGGLSLSRLGLPGTALRKPASRYRVGGTLFSSPYSTGPRPGANALFVASK